MACEQATSFGSLSKGLLVHKETERSPYSPGSASIIILRNRPAADQYLQENPGAGFEPHETRPESLRKQTFMRPDTGGDAVQLVGNRAGKTENSPKQTPPPEQRDAPPATTDWPPASPGLRRFDPAYDIGHLKNLRVVIPVVVPARADAILTDCDGAVYHSLAAVW